MYHNVLSNRSRRVAVVATGAIAVALWSAAAGAQSDPKDILKCQRTLVKEANKVEAKRAKGLRKCNDAALKDGAPVVCPDPENAAKIADAEQKMRDKVQGACTDAGITLAEIGWAGLVSRCVGGSNDTGFCTVPADCPLGGVCTPTDECPNLFNGNLMADCSDPLGTPGDVADCLICNGNNVVMGPIAIAYKHFPIPVPLNEAEPKDVLKCQRAIGKEIVKYLGKERKALAKCKDGVLKAGSGSCPDGDASAAIADALGKLQDKISDTGSCPAGTFPNAVDRRFILDWIVIPIPILPPIPPIDILDNYRNALVNVTDTLSQCSSELATGDIAAGCQPLCGNGKIEAGETCDDGNQVAGDSCPPDCSVAACTDAGDVTATVRYTPPAGVDLAAIQVIVGYDESKVRIPGSGGASQVLNRIVLTDPLASISANDLNYAIRLFANTAGDPLAGEPDLLTIDFDTCMGAPAPNDGDFTCIVQDSSDAAAAGAVLGTTCSVDVP